MPENTPAGPGPTALPASAQHLILLIARVLLGVIMIAHGWQKLVTNGLGPTTAGFTKLGVPLPAVSAAITGGVELIGGILLVLGLLTTLAGGSIALILAGAFWFAHRGTTIFAQQGGWELVAALGLAALVIAAVGPGRYSLDTHLQRFLAKKTA
ncbi:DoxX family protein [Austwickia chelonae]|uniref:DoxX family protein n=1 Tax=Austwickia chelonae TaxID=100225 RepID=UPI000E2633D4|nr:DoxX family protein [Austwickia chelonae]